MFPSDANVSFLGFDYTAVPVCGEPSNLRGIARKGIALEFYERQQHGRPIWHALFYTSIINHIDHQLEM